MGFAAGFDIAVPGFGAGGRDADDDNVCAFGRNFSCTLDVGAEMFLVGNHVVGRKHSDHCRWIVAGQQERRQADGGRRVSSNRLGNNLLLVELLQLPDDGAAQVFIGDDPELFRLGQRQQAFDSLLNHAFAAVERKKLLGHAFAAQGPETRAAATSEDDGIEIELAEVGQCV